MVLIHLVIAQSAMVGIHPYVNVYHIFRFEPTNVISLGVSRFLKESTTAMMGDENRALSNIMKSLGALRTFKQVRKIIPNFVNNFRRVVEYRSVVYRLHVDKSKGDIGNRRNEFSLTPEFWV